MAEIDQVQTSAPKRALPSFLAKKEQENANKSVILNRTQRSVPAFIQSANASKTAESKKEEELRKSDMATLFKGSDRPASPPK